MVKRASGVYREGSAPHVLTRYFIKLIFLGGGGGAGKASLEYKANDSFCSTPRLDNMSL